MTILAILLALCFGAVDSADSQRDLGELIGSSNAGSSIPGYIIE